MTTPNKGTEETAADLSKVVKTTADELKASNETIAAEVKGAAEKIATEVKTTAEQSASTLAQLVVDTAEDLKASNERIATEVREIAEHNAAALASVVLSTAAEVKETSDKNSAIGPLLLQGMTIITKAVSELSDAAADLASQAAAEQAYLKDRAKYFIGVIAAVVILSAATLFVGLQLYASGNDRSEQLRIINNNQTCAVIVSSSNPSSPADAERMYEECVSERSN